MSTEPTRALKGDYLHENCRVVGCSACAERGRVEPALRAPRQPAVAPVEPPAGPERGTGEPEAHGSAQTIEYRCPDCYRWAPWTDGLQASDGEDHDEFWCQTCGSQTPLENMESRAPQLIPADLIESNPGIRGGEPCMKGTRVPASDVAGLLADGLGWHQVHEYWPSVPVPEGTVCTGRACDCRWGPAEKAVDHYLHGKGGSTQLYNIEIADITRIVTRHAYIEVAASLDNLGHHDAARAVRSAAKDLEDERPTS